MSYSIRWRLNTQRRNGVQDLRSYSRVVVDTLVASGLMSQPRNPKHKWTNNQRDSGIRTRLLPMRSIIPQLSQPPLPLLFRIDGMEPRTRMASIWWSWVVRVKEEEDTDAQTGKNSV